MNYCNIKSATLVFSTITSTGAAYYMCDENIKLRNENTKLKLDNKELKHELKSKENNDNEVNHILITLIGVPF